MIELKFRSPLVIISLLLMIFLMGCMGDSEKFIQGYWIRGDDQFTDQWYFDRGFFSHETDLYFGDLNNTSGRYQVINYQDDRLILEMDNTNLSYGDERPQFLINIDWESDTIRIRGEIYERVIP